MRNHWRALSSIVTYCDIQVRTGSVSVSNHGGGGIIEMVRGGQILDVFLK